MGVSSLLLCALLLVTTSVYGGIYSVQSGDTCFGIISSQSLTLPQLIACNAGSFSSCDDLPNSLSVSYCYGIYTVQSGESCASIASKFSMTMANFVAANPAISCNNLQAGTSVTISTASSTTPTKTPAPTTPAPTTPAPSKAPTRNPTTPSPTQGTPAPTQRTPAPTSSSGGGGGGGAIVLAQNFDSVSSVSSLSPTWNLVYPDCSGQSTASIDKSVSVSSPNSLLVAGINGYCNHIFLASDLSSLISGDLYVRFNIRFSQPLGSGHVSFVTVKDSVSGKNLRMGGQAGIMMWNRESDDATLPNLSPQGIALSFSPAVNTWYCMEFALANSGGKTILTTWANGVRVDGMSVGNTVADSQWTKINSYKPLDLKVGFEGYSGSSTNIWYDDIQVSASRIGC
eukprot:TRINITY_DN3901_c0_g1_i1.p1 TRINITY_DN3901_c0_g1~~TRINITY_DN3901_c0_g1_i1.p1  ORF type:complete len:399 (-),score=98.92 TRINITY_DN3901_c0_g1_i1:36-1232(-)